MQITHYWVNGELVPTAQATISVLDHGFTVADGVFETLLVENGQAFAINRHLARLNRSAVGLGITPPDSKVVETAIAKVLEVHSGLEFGRLRITVTSGNGPLGSDRTGSSPTLVVSVANQNVWPESTSVLLVPWTRNENSPLAGLKTTSYAENVYALDTAKRHGFSEAIFCDTSGRLCEGTGSNIFLVSKGAVSTPSDASGLLRGITRDLLIEWARTAGVSIVERDVDPDELWDADEVFITSSTRNVHPVTELAQLDAAGKVTKHREIDLGLKTQNLGNIFLASRSETSNP